MAEAAAFTRNPSQMAMLRQAGMLVGIAASVALGVYVVMWARTPNYSMLYGNLADKDMSQVVDALAAADIAYRLDHASGTILVPSAHVHEARLKLAAAGLPKSAGLGFELLDEDQGFGTSQFIERARYQRAIEGELSRSITRINHVRAARVHLAMPAESVFTRSKRTPSASVIVDLYQGHRLEPHQVGAITHLVSASVPNLPASRVTVVDQHGNLLTDQDGDDDMLVTLKRFEHTRRIERSYVDRIEAILTPLVGPDGVRAQVAADVDYTATEQTRESFNPDLPAVRSERLLEEENTGAQTGGVPGALSNEPPTAAAAPEEVAAPGAAGAAAPAEEGARPVPPPQNRRSQTTRNYELDRTISHTKPSVGTIRRLSVAVVVRNPLRPVAAQERRGEAGPQETAPAAYTPEELERMTSLVREAIGFDAARGDSVRITSADFLAPAAPEALPEPPIWKQPWLWDVTKQVLGGLFILFLLLGVLRPAMKSLMTRHHAAAGQLVDGTAALPPGSEGALPRGASGSLPGPARHLPYAEGPAFDGDLEQVKQYVNQDPRIAAQVVRGWVGDTK